MPVCFLSCIYLYYSLNFVSWPQSLKWLPCGPLKKKFTDPNLRQRGHEIFTNRFVNEPQTLYRSSSFSTDYLQKEKKSILSEKNQLWFNLEQIDTSAPWWGWAGYPLTVSGFPHSLSGILKKGREVIAGTASI